LTNHLQDDTAWRKLFYFKWFVISSSGGEPVSYLFVQGDCHVDGCCHQHTAGQWNPAVGLRRQKPSAMPTGYPPCS